MEIQALKLHVGEGDVNELVTRHLPPSVPVSDLQVRLKPEGVHVAGVIQLFVSMRFETRWELTVRDGRLGATLSDVQVIGFGGRMIKGVLLKSLAEWARGEDAIHVEDDALWIDVDQLLAHKGISLRTNLRTVACGEGSIAIESAAARTA